MPSTQWLQPSPRRADPRRYDELPQRDRERVDAAAKLLADLAVDGWEETVAGRVRECLDDRTWNRLFRGRRQQDCEVLADAAKAILQGRNSLHQAAGSIGGRVARLFGAEPIEEAIVRQLVAKMPIPVIDQKAFAVARGLQMIGILLCLSVDVPMTRCQSFIDLSRTETAHQVQQILVAALDDWTRADSTTLSAWVW